MIRFNIVVGANVSVDDNGASDYEGQKQSQHDDYDLHGHTMATKSRRADSPDQNRLERPHKSGGRQIDDSRQRGLQDIFKR